MFSLWLNNIPRYNYTSLYFIYSFVGEHLGYFNFLATVHSAAMNICVQVFVWIRFQFFWVTA